MIKFYNFFLFLFLFFILFLSFFISIGYTNQNLENDYNSTSNSIKNISSQIAENSAMLVITNQEILRIKKKNSNKSNWLDEIKLTLLLKKSHSISFEIERLLNQKNILNFVIKDIEKKLLVFYEKKIISLAYNKIQNTETTNQNTENTKLIYDYYIKKESLLSHSANYAADTVLPLKHVDKSLIENEKDVFVKLGLIQDLLSELKIKMSDIDNKVKFLNKEIDFSEKLIYYFSFSKNEIAFKMTIRNKRADLKKLKNEFVESLSFYSNEYALIAQDEKMLKYIVFQY